MFKHHVKLKDNDGIPPSPNKQSPLTATRQRSLTTNGGRRSKFNASTEEVLSTPVPPRRSLLSYRQSSAPVTGSNNNIQNYNDSSINQQHFSSTGSGFFDALKRKAKPASVPAESTDTPHSESQNSFSDHFVTQQRQRNGELKTPMQQQKQVVQIDGVIKVINSNGGAASINNNNHFLTPRNTTSPNDPAPPSSKGVSFSPSPARKSPYRMSAKQPGQKSPVRLSPGGKKQFAKMSKFAANQVSSSQMYESKNDLPVEWIDDDDDNDNYDDDEGSNMYSKYQQKYHSQQPQHGQLSSSPSPSPGTKQRKIRRRVPRASPTPPSAKTPHVDINERTTSVDLAVQGFLKQTEGLLIHQDESESNNVDNVELSHREPTNGAELSHRESTHGNTTTSTARKRKIPKLYTYTRRCEWDRVLTEINKNPRDAQFASIKDGTTALHLAVMSRTNPSMRDGELEYKAASLDLIEDLVMACPEAASMRCSVKKYTPLSYACLVSDLNYDMDDCAEIVKTILYHAPQSAYVFTDDGFSALDVHIVSYSRLHKEKEEVYSGGRTSTVVFRTLLAEKPDLAGARAYTNKIRGPLELLYRCNTNEFTEALDGDYENMDQKEEEKKRQTRNASVASMLSDWWAWKWALLLLKFSNIENFDIVNKSQLYSPLCAAAKIVGCPLPIIALAYESAPTRISERDPRNDLYNLPLHDVCSWECDREVICGDAFVVARKAKAIKFLLKEFPESARMTNNMGETPLQLAIETCTAWHGGLEDLVTMCPKALRFPRRVRRLPDVNAPLISVPNHDYDQESLDSDDEDPMEALMAIDGMYPFMVAAVMSYVPEHKLKPHSFLYNDDQAAIAEHYENLRKKDLNSVRSIYGLLRAKPEVLDMYRRDRATEKNGGDGKAEK